MSFGRLAKMEFEELVVCCGPPTDGRLNPPHDSALEWAVVARLVRPTPLDAIRERWRNSPVDGELGPDPAPTAVQIEGRECFRVQAGTFLMPQRRYGRLRFTDRSGQPVEQGINVGRVNSSRGFIEGGTESSAIFTLDHVTSADVVEDHLPLELRPDVFLTSALDHEFTTATIALRNPVTGLRSEPIRFQAKSYVTHRLNVPREIPVVDAGGRRQVDLFQDLVAGSRLEVVIQADEGGVYLGVEQHDLSVRLAADEYVLVSDREIVITQSEAMLKNMIQASDSPARLANRLTRADADIVIVADAQDKPRQDAWQSLSRTLSEVTGAEFPANDLIDVVATVLTRKGSN